ncbi:serine threonine protein kinase [Stylonychia lemnae]|uniref:non-specific serine/threonine protein kinase n=1 Tax=Stylonychia lemnae TaxID=5949 RepID=A0A078A1M1_STYLE|nr:serine threonine protein kinase [Stylonychia lemnae]|eukprot:CDW76156.1 serine threonine protein kinase [Stylonychia lemnae]
MTCQQAFDDQPQQSIEEYFNQDLTVSNGLSLKNFEIIKSIGSGGFGTVSLKDNSTTPSWYLCILMDYASNGDLSQLIERHKSEKQPINEEVIWNICKQVAIGLQYLHQKKIIHRDIKPQNILITTYNQYKIADMGISRNLNSNNSQLHTSKIGTPLYQAPELIRKQPYDYKIDMWALGCLLHYLAAQEHPFTVPPSTRDVSPIKQNNGIVNSRTQLEYQILNHTPKNIPEIYSTKLQLLIQKLLDKNKDNRPNSEEVLKLIPSSDQPLFTLNGNLSQTNFYQAPQVSQKRHSAANRSANASKVQESYPLNQKTQQENVKTLKREQIDEKVIKSSNTDQQEEMERGGNTLQVSETKATDADFNTAQFTYQQYNNIKLNNFSKTFYKASEQIQQTPHKQKAKNMFEGSKKQISHTPGKTYGKNSVLNNIIDEKEQIQPSDFSLRANRSLILESQNQMSKSPDITQNINLKDEIRQIYDSQRAAQEQVRNFANLSTLDDRKKEFEKYQLRNSYHQLNQKKARYNSNYPTQRIYAPTIPQTNPQKNIPITVQSKSNFPQNQSLTQFSNYNNKQNVQIIGANYQNSLNNQNNSPDLKATQNQDQKVAVSIYDPLLSNDNYDLQQTIQNTNEAKASHKTPNINSIKVDGLSSGGKSYQQNNQFHISLKHHHRKVVATGTASVERYSVSSQQNHPLVSSTLKQNSIQQQFLASQLPKINKNVFLKTNFRNQRLTVRDLAQ